MAIEAHSKEFDEGWQAYQDDADFVKDNPHPQGSKEYDEWREGYMAAEDAEGKEDEEDEEEDDTKDE